MEQIETEGQGLEHTEVWTPSSWDDEEQKTYRQHMTDKKAEQDSSNATKKKTKTNKNSHQNL